MWLLQHKNIHKKHLLWLKIVGVCLLLHLIALVWVFCIYRENKFMYAFSINKKIDYSAPILFVPLGSAIDAKTVTAQKTTAAKSSIPKAPATPKIEPKQTIIASKPVVKKVEEKPKVEPKKIEKEELKPAPIEKIELKKEDILPPQNKALQDKENKISKVLDIQQDIVPVSPNKKIDIPAQPVIPANAQISHDFREVEALRCGAQLQKELAQQWHPPIGVWPDCTCDISFFVNKKGTIENLKIVKSSNVMMFDISARQALFSMKMPQWTYGKPLIISFKQ